MWFDQLYLEDFGCYRRQRMEGLHRGLVVIGGPQRAGKTTFMRILRHLGFGLPRDGRLPPAADRYAVEARAVHEKYRYLLSVSGYSEPRVTPQDGAPEIAIDQIYGGVPRFSYRQIFTISLDELKRLPARVGKSDAHRLQAVLLGAGWADVIRIPRLIKELEREADKIGGKHGRAVYQLKAPLEQVREGVNQRDEALAQVDEFRALQKKICTLKGNVEDRQQELDRLRHKVTRLRLVEEYWEDKEEYLQLERELSREEAAKILRTYPDDGHDRATELKDDLGRRRSELTEAHRSLRERLGTEEVASRTRMLVENTEVLRKYEQDLSGWRERVRVYRKEHADLEGERLRLGESAGRVWQEWQGEPDRMAGVRVDIVSRGRLKETVDRLRELRDRENTLAGEMESLRRQLADAERALDRQDRPGLGGRWLQGLAVVGASALLGYLVGRWLDLWVGLGVGVVAAVLLLAPMVFQFVREQGRRAGAEDTVGTLQGHLDDREETARDVESEMQEVQCRLHQLREELGVPAQVSAGDILEFYDRVRRLKEQVSDLHVREEAHARQEEEISALLGDPARLMEQLRQFRRDGTSFVDWADDLFSTVTTSLVELDLAIRYQRAEKELDDVRERVLGLLQEVDPEAGADDTGARELLVRLERFCRCGERYLELKDMRATWQQVRQKLLTVLNTESHRKVLDLDDETSGTDNRVLEAFLRLAEEHVSGADAAAERVRLEDEVASLEDELDELREDRVRVRQRMEEISTDENLRRAQAAIEQGRANLRPLTVRYASLRIAERLLHRLQRRFVERAHGSLLEQASRIFRNITGDAYESIQTLEDPSEPDFRVVGGEIPVELTTSALSGATEEQLFFAVRLARIREIEHPLPVILDDSAANFDPRHRMRTLAVIDEIARSHQVFLLTCHPEMVEMAARTVDGAQYWCLEDGRFSGPFEVHRPLLDLLECED